MIQAHEALGPITCLIWNGVKDPKSLMEAHPEDLDAGYRLCVTSLVASVLACMDDLKQCKGCVIATGDGLALEKHECVKEAIEKDLDTLAVDKAGQRKAIHLLHERMKPEGVFVGECCIESPVKGTKFDVGGKAKLTSEDVADHIYQAVKKRPDDPFCHVK
ncbi:hypothetical protein HDU76_008534 [Blyttiomyces sp. JEL0837]|nr:hypothetical protein HDU76_008534 [Blyttiomyces sp. JEL0837]